jgi:cytochrome b
MNQPHLPDVKNATTIKVWDLPVRIFHWSLVLLFAAAYITNSLGPEWFTYHAWCGYGIIVLVSFRLIWGLVGTYHARFTNFISDPITSRFLSRDHKPHTGHNPLGAIMVITLLLTILVQAATGLFTNDEIFNVGPLVGYISSELSLELTSLHRQLFYWIAGAVALHVLAVLYHVFFKRDGILKAMFTGKKSGEHLADEPSISSSRLWLALVIILVLSGILAWLILHAPEAVTADFDI